MAGHNDAKRGSKSGGKSRGGLKENDEKPLGSLINEINSLKKELKSIKSKKELPKLVEGQLKYS